MGNCPCTKSNKAHAEVAGPAGDNNGNVPQGNSADPRVGEITEGRGGRGKRENGLVKPDKPDPPPPPKPGDPTQTEDERQVLKVVEVDLMISSNSRTHHTERYEQTQIRVDEAGKQVEPLLVVRRGEPFEFSIKFDRKFDENKDDIRLIFDIGPTSKEGLGTRVTLLLSDTDEPRQWGAKISKSRAETMTLRIFTPPSLAVAKWNLKLDIIVKNDKNENKVFRYVHPHPIYILFNPWFKDDTVYVSEDAMRLEYVLNDKGRIYCGTSDQISSRPWNFGQFEDFVLEASLYLLDNSGLSWRLRGDPVHIVRKISALANSPDDNGVLVGNWSGEYEGGTAPFKWFGSVGILEEFWKTKSSVKYGQCWVFSGVVTTICRCLGIPARSVTNFSSAHDSDGSITIDSYWTKDGKPMEEYNEDSVWNFHVWNEVWMARPDLPPGFGGWQAVDATPQERSDGIYCAGPASVEALKNGLVHLPYDGPFIFAEVNADKVHWIQKEEGGWAHTIESCSIGKHISTTCVKTRKRIDITDAYKFPEGSEQERTAVWRAAKECSTRQELYKAEAEDMEFEMKEKDDTLIGEDFEVTMKVRNKSTELRNVCITLTATVVNYTGVPYKVIKTCTTSVKIKPQEVEMTKMTVKVDEYLDKLIDMCHIKISSMCRVEETKQFHCQCDDFRLLKPKITVEVPSKVKVGEEFTVVARFINPLPTYLTHCAFQVEAALLKRPFPIKYSNIKARQEAKVSTKLIPRQSGDKEIIVSFESRELWALSGTAKLSVT